MFRKLLILLVMSLWGSVVLPLPQKASAVTPLTLAVIQELKNLVQLVPHNKPQRQARKLDSMIPGDGLSTGRASLAELRFNDGSMARIGQQAVFQFLPKTRNLRLSNGTILLLIRPGQGKTQINTPNAAAAIRGSALFVRYDPQTDTTIVGALTNSGIQVQNKNASQNQNLAAGQLIVVVKDRFQGLYDFDLRTFYETSNLVRGLDLTLKSGVPSLDPAIASVQAETAAAVATQQPLIGQGVIENLPVLTTTTSSGNTSTHHSSDRIHNNLMRDYSPVENLLDTGQVLSNTGKGSNSKPATQPVNNNPGNNNPGNGNPGNGNPGNGNPGNGNPGNDNPVGNPGNGNPGNGNPSDNNPAQN
ncbi:iron dicitrate transport regulator FecR [Scytonema sp. UIC 10036]|nr:iron dicitrate transport regulator FecR [Scytonema sp. UIC 10036]